MKQSAGLGHIRVVAGALAGLLSYACHAQPAANLVANPGFERGLTGWEVVNPVGAAATVEVVSDTRNSGQSSLHAANANAKDLRPLGVRQVLAVQGGRTYRLAVHSQNTALQSSGGVRVTVLDADGGRLSQTWAVQLHTWESGWTLAERTISIPARGVRAELLLSVNGLGEVWFDDVSLVEQPAAPNPAEQTVEQIPAGIAVTRFPAPAPVMKIAAADVDGDGRDEVLLGDIEHGLSLVKDGQVLWRVDVGGLPCDIACGDADGDGRQEIAVATMDVDGNTLVLSPAGERMWHHAVDDNRCSRVAWADLKGDRTEELLIGSGPVLTAFDGKFEPLWELNVGGPRLTALATSDTDGDGRDEVFAGYEAQTLRLVALDDDGNVLWRHAPSDWPGSTKVSSVFLADADGDGSLEIIAGGSGGTAFVLRADATELWRRVARRRPRELYLAEPVQYTQKYPGTQMLLMGRHSISIRASAGPEIFASASGITLIDSAHSSTEPNVVYAASSGPRDPAFYRLEFSDGGRNQLASYEVSDPLGSNLDAAYRRTVALDPLPAPNARERQRKFHVLLYRNSREQVRAAWELLRTRSTPNVEYVILSYVKELPVELHRFPMTTLAEILDYARFFERERIPFYLFVDHGCRPWITVDTARKILDAAPAASRGFYVAEDNYRYPDSLFYEWLDWAGKLLDLCHERGKKVIFKEMHDTWSLLASDKAVYDVLFKYPDTIVPMYATNNPHAPEIQIGGMVGLWRAGRCRDWGMSSQHWNWNWQCVQRIDYSELCPPDVILRMDLAAAALGCTYFHVEGGQKWIDNSGTLLPEATRHRELLYQLMERNVILPPEATQLVGLSPVAIARTTDPRAAGEARIGLPAGRIGTPFREGLLGVRASMQTPPPYYLPAYAYGVRHYFDGLFPATPYGYIELLPGFIAGRAANGTSQLIHTDTSQVTLDGKTMSAEVARPVVLSMLRAAAERLPFRADRAFLSAQKWSDEYRLVLVDPGYLNPVGCRARVQINLPQSPTSVSDLLTGERIAVQDNAFEVDIAAGGFRLLGVAIRHRDQPSENRY